MPACDLSDSAANSGFVFRTSYQAQSLLLGKRSLNSHLIPSPQGSESESRPQAAGKRSLTFGEHVPRTSHVHGRCLISSSQQHDQVQSVSTWQRKQAPEVSPKSPHRYGTMEAAQEARCGCPPRPRLFPHPTTAAGLPSSCPTAQFRPPQPSFSYLQEALDRDLPASIISCFILFLDRRLWLYSHRAEVVIKMPSLQMRTQVSRGYPSAQQHLANWSQAKNPGVLELIPRPSLNYRAPPHNSPQRHSALL